MISLRDLEHYSIDTETLAKKLGYHVQYLRLLAAKGKIPAIKRGREWRFNEAEVLEHFQSTTDSVLKENNYGRRKDDKGSDLLR